MSGPATNGGGATPGGGQHYGGGGGSHGPTRSSNYGQGGYVVVKEPEVFLGAQGVWRLQEVYDLIVDGNWSS